MKKVMQKVSRRQIMKLGAAGAVAGFGGAVWPNARASAEARVVDDRERKLLFVFCAYGGASIIDSFMPIVDTEVGDADLAATLNVFPASLVEQRPGRNIRSVKLLDNYSFYGTPPEMGQLVAQHGDHMAVIAHNVSTVNHTVGQQRSLNGGGFNRGRTIMEEMSLRYGGGLALPSCNMAIDGYVRHGADTTVPLEVRHEIISTPLLFATGTHGFKAVANAPSETLIERARSVRDELDQRSAFARTFKNSKRLSSYLYSRREISRSLEKAEMIDKLLLLDPSQVDPKFGIEPSSLLGELRDRFTHMDEDNTEAQVALGFLMAYYGISTSVAMGLKTDPVLHGADIIGAPIAFDFSHNLHRVVQSMMWGRTADLIDKLITLLKTHDYMGNPDLGKMWDRSLVYIATEFGRDKVRPRDAANWGTSHHLNNGSVLISPLLKGNAVYGGVDPKTGITYGFDPVTGEPDPAVTLYESDVYSIIAQALDIDFPGRRDFPAVVG